MNKALEVAERSVENEVKRRNQYAHEGDELDRQVEALKADAERYRHIRENADTMHWENMLKADIETLEDIDAAIDAARTAKLDEGCPLCNGDCSAANPPVMNCPIDK